MPALMSILGALVMLGLAFAVSRNRRAISWRAVLWGVALQCPDLAGAVSEIRGRGVTVSDIREGRKAGTRVATVKSHCLGIPTLLIGPAT